MTRWLFYVFNRNYSGLDSITSFLIVDVLEKRSECIKRKFNESLVRVYVEEFGIEVPDTKRFRLHSGT